MPRQDRIRAEVISAPAPKVPPAFMASAANLTMNKSGKPKAKIPSAEWQTQAWNFYDLIGEFRYATNWIGNLLSKATLLPLKNGTLTTDTAAVEALGNLFGGPEGQADMLRGLGLHLTVAGEAYVVGLDGGDSPEDEWMVLSGNQVKLKGDAYEILDDMQEDALVIRIWQSHPRDVKKADAPSRAVLPIMSELNGLTKRVAAETESRLTGAGLLLIPNEISMPTMPVTNAAPDPEDPDGDLIPQQSLSQADAVLQMLIQTFSTALGDPSSAAAMVPAILQMPGEFIDKVKHLTFWSEFAQQSIELRKEAIHRLALGLDMPPEALEGTGDMNHWNAWQMEEGTIKANSEPFLARIAAALTTGYLRPMLIADGMDKVEAAAYSIGTDTSGLRIRPNRSKEAGELYDRGVLNKEALLRENGFEPDDGTSPQQVSEWLTQKVASGQTTPELVAAALEVMGVKLPVAALTAGSDSEQPTHEARPTPSLEKHPTQDPPEQEDAVTAAASILVYRALERAGNRLKKRLDTSHVGVHASTIYRFVPIELSEMDALLDGAWACPPEFSFGLPMDRLDSYTRTLLATQRAHDPALLRRYLALDQKGIDA